MLLGVLVFVLREIWGMDTATLTPLLAAGQWDEYTLARWISLAGTLIWAGIYLAFHSYGVAFLFAKLTKMTWQSAIVMQSFVVAILVIEKALMLVLFLMVGYTTVLSMFSFGPLAATFIDIPFLTYFFNQLTVFTALIIAIQYRFVRSFTEYSPKRILFILILLHVFVALIIASLSYVPVTDMLEGFTREGASLGE
ncbi:hypothetical protein [Planococcus sp. YIM B11945]|uniref:hypothetical protein n=1 Tax=Planococcus sp. YIM B11945 TaxID=3435410 RepID=UPI003D7E14B7